MVTVNRLMACHVVGMCFLLGGLTLISEGVSARCVDARVSSLPEYRVSSVIDGDSLRVLGVGNIRLLGVNAPEMKRNRQVKESQPEPYGIQATQFVGQLEGQVVRLEIRGEDRYQRKLAHVWFHHEGIWRSLEAELLERGLAFQVFESADDQLTACFQTAERLARAAQQGVWSALDYWKNARRGGFVIWRGQAQKISKGKTYTWVRLSNDRVVRLVNQWLLNDSYRFEAQTYEFRGWAVDRQKTKYERFALKLRQTSAIHVY